MLFLSFRLSCLASKWFPKIREKSPKFKFLKVVFYQNNSQHKSYNENASCFTSISSKCINNSKLNSNAFK